MNYLNVYADFLKKLIRPSRKIKAVFDCSNGAAGLIVKKLKNKNLELKIINEGPDGRFPAHGPNPLKKTALRDLRLAVRRHKADLGVIFDADGDRAVFMDNLGRVVGSDAVGYLLINYLYPKKTIIDPRASWLLKKLPNRIIAENRVGHYFIKKQMRKTKTELAIEGSGHYYFRVLDGYFDSGILAAIQAINALSRLPYSLADFTGLIPQYYRSGEINFKIGNPRKILKTIEKKYKKQAVSVSHLDGLTMEFKGWPVSRSLGEGWWFNLRQSNTEPFIRLNIETTSKKLLNQKIKELQKIIDKFKCKK
ncbi:hypothetical protein HZB06_02425 [Candidatus Wolfebacteria bacterium]|nr:hypothetical protein [Candidatus Wolfebacteria bacterium]